VLQTEHQGLARHRLFNRLSVGGELVADRGANEVRAVGIKAFLHYKSICPRSTKPRLIVIFSVPPTITTSLPSV
jgi:hypothetical protein